MELEPGTGSSPPTLSFSLLNSTVLDLEVKSLLGHRTKIKDLPKLTNILLHRIKTAFTLELVWPSVKRIPLPRFSLGNDDQSAESAEVAEAPPHHHSKDD